MSLINCVGPTMVESPMCRKKLEGKVAIVTGGASGIGEVTARLFANNGARMVVIADIQDELGQKIAKSIGLNSTATYIHCDVSDEEQVKAMVEWTVQNYKQLDIMFSNAGVYSKSNQTILDLDFPSFEHLFAINVRGMAACVKHAARTMVEGHVRGSIVCTASVAASCGAKKHIDYFMSKHAVLGMVRSASKQLGVHGIRVNCVSPYVVATPLTLQALGMDAEQAEEVEKIFEPYVVLKGALLKAKHVADAVLFLASDDSECVTGHNLVVDRGYLGAS
ncbi:(+)-cis,trans-nepetalactol synthase NEPS2-like [Juglans microcarpa x Juglans regia]|uniref:(+)-cis,trans-nepetalactol synthase NEPS2-like n=1 Tax=Juglans microcarpa x Juglans regia TaxID=2249226 RepID=UPI001B7EFDEC|nr:(+)-cis,trans-nepetalactol synthase NEPS2-like [Juglans microcarpa x Juglans regia]